MLQPGEPASIAVDVTIRTDPAGQTRGGDVVVVGMGAGDIPIFVLGIDKYAGSARIPDESGAWRVTFDIPEVPSLRCAITLSVSVLDPTSGDTLASRRFSQTTAVAGRQSSGLVAIEPSITVTKSA
jgi:hypothetical protein